MVAPCRIHEGSGIIRDTSYNVRRRISVHTKIEKKTKKTNSIKLVKTIILWSFKFEIERQAAQTSCELDRSWITEAL